MVLMSTAVRTAAFLVLVCSVSALAQTELERNVIAGGGGTTSSANHSVTLTVGQPAIGNVANASYHLSIGFWSGGLADLTAALDDGVPLVFSLDQNYPNPFNPATVIRFSLPETAPVSLAIYNVRGVRVRQLLDETRAAGPHEVVWSGLDDHGRGLPSGTYVARIASSAGVQNRKMLLAR